MDGILLSFYVHQLWTEGHAFIDSARIAACVPDPLEAFGLMPSPFQRESARTPSGRWQLSSPRGRWRFWC